MLDKLKSSLMLADLFEACIWAITCCAFWGLMHFGEVSVWSRNAFSPALHLTHANMLFGTDLNGQNYVRLDLPSAKTHVFLVEQDSLCPLEALHHLAVVVPARPSDPLFSWRDLKRTFGPWFATRCCSSLTPILPSWSSGQCSDIHSALVVPPSCCHKARIPRLCA